LNKAILSNNRINEDQLAYKHKNKRRIHLKFGCDKFTPGRFHLIIYIRKISFFYKHQTQATTVSMIAAAPPIKNTDVETALKMMGLEHFLPNFEQSKLLER